MDRNKLKELLDALASGGVTTEQALEQLKNLPYAELGFAKLDNHRSVRQGMPEVIFCPGKSAEQIATIASHIKSHHDVVVATRCEPDPAKSVLAKLDGASYYEQARMIVWGAPAPPDPNAPFVAVVTAGTADIPVAEEAAMFLNAAGIRVERLYDVGVAGIHRLLANTDVLNNATATIVVAGMDGALPSVVGGLLEGPVIAVPTSVGYGASFQGIAALLTMLNSCAAGLTVVNIDNGFGAAVAAIRIMSQVSRALRGEAAEVNSYSHRLPGSPA